MNQNYLAKRVVDLKPSGIRKFFDIVATMQDVISLGIGEPDFSTPAGTLQAGIRSLQAGETHYTSNAGRIELRQALAQHLERLYEVSYDPLSELLVTVGVSEALYLAMMHADLEEKKALLRAAVESRGTCRERLRRLTQIFLELPREKRDLIKLVRAYQAALPEQIEIILRDGIRDGELAPADPRLLAWLNVALVEVVLTRYAESVLQSPENVLDFVTNLFFNGAGRATA